MSAKIQLQNPNKRPLEASRLQGAARATLDRSGSISGASLSIIVADSEALRACNRQHRQTDAATDVLSFAALPLPDAIDAEAAYLGDILIAYDYVAAHCEARGCRLSDALCLLVIHGTLHLLGYGHDSDAARARMWRAQAAILQSLGISPDLVRQYEAADG